MLSNTERVYITTKKNSFSNVHKRKMAYNIRKKTKQSILDLQQLNNNIEKWDSKKSIFGDRRIRNAISQLFLDNCTKGSENTIKSLISELQDYLDNNR